MFSGFRRSEDTHDQRNWFGTRRSPRRIATSVLLVLLLVGTGSGAAWGYDRVNEATLPPGTTIADVHVGNLSVTDATARMHNEVVEPLHRPIRLTAGDVVQETTPWELGLRADVQEAVASALEDHRSANLLERTWRRIAALGGRVSLEPEFQDEITREALSAFAAQVERPPIDAAVELVDGWLEARPSQIGLHLDVDEAKSHLIRVLGEGVSDIDLPVRTLAPEVPTEALGRAILIHTGSNRLYLYENGQIVREYPVASGKRGYSTPTGQFHITAKRRNPSWGNPGSPWARNMPRFIGPGPNNPLGTRAMNINSRGIRIHGTADRASIGRHASHGCVRMYREHVEELFELVDVGTAVVIVRL